MLRHNVNVLLDELQTASYFACLSPKDSSKYVQKIDEIKLKILDVISSLDKENRMLVDTLWAREDDPVLSKGSENA